MDIKLENINTFRSVFGQRQLLRDNYLLCVSYDCVARVGKREPSKRHFAITKRCYTTQSPVPSASSWASYASTLSSTRRNWKARPSFSLDNPSPARWSFGCKRRKKFAVCHASYIILDGALIFFSQTFSWKLKEEQRSIIPREGRMDRLTMPTSGTSAPVSRLHITQVKTRIDLFS